MKGVRVLRHPGALRSATQPQGETMELVIGIVILVLIGIEIWTDWDRDRGH